MSAKHLALAAAHARRGVDKKAGGPFGAVIVRKGRVIAKAHNTVLKDRMASRHAEINAIEAASRKLKRFDLSDCEIVSTTEPCPMCFSAIHWARIPRITYATTIRDVHKLGFNEMPISNAALKKWGRIMKLTLRRERNSACERLLAYWASLPVKQTY